MISIKDLGGPTKVANMTGLSVPTVHGWKTIPSHHCPAIELATAGEFVCEVMRPDLTWQRVPDPEWPHKDGRPLLDFAPQAESPPPAQPMKEAA